jgi:hypothetical protein
VSRVTADPGRTASAQKPPKASEVVALFLTLFVKLGCSEKSREGADVVLIGSTAATQNA